MTRNLVTAAASLLIVIASAGAVRRESVQPQTAQGGGTPSNTRRASCLLSISWDAETFPLDESVVNALLESSGVKGHVAREVVGRVSDEDLDAYFIVDMDGVTSAMDTAGLNMMIVRLEVFVEAPAPPVAEEALTALCSRLQEELEKVGRDAMRHTHEQIEYAERDLVEARRNLKHTFAVQRSLCEQAGRSDLSREHVRELMADMEHQRQEYEMEALAQNARRYAIQQQIAETSKKVAEQAKTDPVIAELEKVVAIREKRHGRIRQLAETDQVSESELLEGEESIAHAKAELAQHRQEARYSQGGDQLAEWNTELSRLAIDTAELEARLSFVIQRLEKAKPLLALSDNFEQAVSLQLPLAQQAVEEATLRRDMLQRRARSIRRPAVMVIGAEQPK